MGLAICSRGPNSPLAELQRAQLLLPGEPGVVELEVFLVDVVDGSRLGAEPRGHPAGVQARAAREGEVVAGVEVEEGGAFGHAGEEVAHPWPHRAAVDGGAEMARDRDDEALGDELVEAALPSAAERTKPSPSHQWMRRRF